MRELIRTLVQTLAEGRDALHCQVVETKGSTPQKAGARMLVGDDGGQVGTLGGGCVESEVKQKAMRLRDRPAIERHEFILDHDYAWADGLICGGRMVILAESLQGTDAANYFASLLAAMERGEGFTEVVAIDESRAGVPLGSRALFDAGGGVLATYIAPDVATSALAALRPLGERPRPAVHEGLAYLPTLPRIRLVVVGAGHVGEAVADLAARSDFDVWVVDDRRQYANAERFPKVQRLIVGPFDEVLPALDVTPNTYALIVTRGHGHDQEALAHLAPTVAPYVGMIGSRRKIRMIFESLRESGMSEDKLARVSAPVGLDIGSETVAEIAVSIVAELIARRNLAPKAGMR
jgi:xanthine dehydrogenase accessory factor